MTFNDRHIEKKEWVLSVPIFRNSTILRQSVLAIGIPFGLLCIFLIFSSSGGNRIYAQYALGLIATLFLLTYLFIMVLYGGKYDVGFVMDDKGILCYTQPAQAKKNRIVNGLTAVLGLLSGKPAAAGAGMLAQSSQKMLIKWKMIRKVKYVPKQYTIMIKGGFTENMAVFCTKDNYAEIESILKDEIR